jgi:hypothetical protein
VLALARPQVVISALNLFRLERREVAEVVDMETVVLVYALLR